MGDKLEIPKHYLHPKSNLMSDNEIYLLYWMEYNFKKVKNKVVRLKHFTHDLNKGLVFRSIINNYVGEMVKVQ